MKFNPNSFRQMMEMSILVALFLVINNAKNPLWVYWAFGIAFIIVIFQLYQAITYRFGKTNFFLLPTPADSTHRFITLFTGSFMILASLVSFLLPIAFLHSYNYFFLGLGSLIFLNGIFKNAYKKLQFFEQSIYIDDVSKAIEAESLTTIIVANNSLTFVNKQEQRLVIQSLQLNSKTKEKLQTFLREAKELHSVRIQNIE